MSKLNLGVDVLGRIVKPRISKVTIPITYDCNQRCKTCGIWATNLKDPELKKKEITEDEFSKFITKNDLLWVAFTGGEPFSRSDMNRILFWALSYCKMVSITTNGFNPDKILKDVKGALASRGSRPDSYLALNISMNGSREVHDSIAGTPGSFDNARETLKTLRSIQNPRLSVGVSYTSSSFNKGEFDTYLREMKDIGIGLDNITYGMGQDSPSYYQGTNCKSRVYPGEDYIKDFSRTILKDLRIGTDPLKWVSRIYLEGFVKGYQNGKSPKCVASQYSLMLDPYWNSYPCMFYCPSLTIGNLRNTDFDIQGLDLATGRRTAKSCKGCWTPCESYSTIVFRPWRCL